MFKRKIALFLSLFLQNCESTPKFDKTVSSVDIQHYSGKWYVIAMRPTIFESDAYNETESYSLNSGKIDIDFRFRKGDFNGPERRMPQNAKVFNTTTNAHWKVSLWWLPFSMDYLILDLDPQYQWTVVGVPNQKYLWIMSRNPTMDHVELQKIIQRVKDSGYNVDNLTMVPQKW